MEEMGKIKTFLAFFVVFLLVVQITFSGNFKIRPLITNEQIQSYLPYGLIIGNYNLYQNLGYSLGCFVVERATESQLGQNVIGIAYDNGKDYFDLVNYALGNPFKFICYPSTESWNTYSASNLYLTLNNQETLTFNQNLKDNGAGDNEEISINLRPYNDGTKIKEGVYILAVEGVDVTVGCDDDPSKFVSQPINCQDKVCYFIFYNHHFNEEVANYLIDYLTLNFNGYPTYWFDLGTQYCRKDEYSESINVYLSNISSYGKMIGGTYVPTPFDTYYGGYYSNQEFIIPSDYKATFGYPITEDTTRIVVGNEHWEEAVVWDVRDIDNNMMNLFDKTAIFKIPMESHKAINNMRIFVGATSDATTEIQRTIAILPDGKIGSDYLLSPTTNYDYDEEYLKTKPIFGILDIEYREGKSFYTFHGSSTFCYAFNSEASLVNSFLSLTNNNNYYYGIYGGYYPLPLNFPFTYPESINVETNYPAFELEMPTNKKLGLSTKLKVATKEINSFEGIIHYLEIGENAFIPIYFKENPLVDENIEINYNNLKFYEIENQGGRIHIVYFECNGDSGACSTVEDLGEIAVGNAVDTWSFTLSKVDNTHIKIYVLNENTRKVYGATLDIENGVLSS